METMSSTAPQSPQRHDRPSRSHDHPSRSEGSAAGSLVAGLTGGVVIMSVMSILGGFLAGLEGLSGELVSRIAFGMLAGVALITGVAVAVWRAPNGLAAAVVAGLTAALLLLAMRLFLLAGQPYNPLIFGPWGMAAVTAGATVGGWIGQRLGGERLRARVALSEATRVGVWAALLWVSLEMAVRLAGSLGLGPVLDNALAGDMLAVAIGMPLIAWLIARYGRAHGFGFERWAYRWTALTVVVGVGAGLLALGLMAGTAQIDLRLWGGSDEVPEHLVEGLRAGTWAVVLMLVVNGIVAPVCEEIAWRGVIQTALVQAWGPALGVVVAALLFASKHVLVDGSLSRVTTLVMLGLVLGVVRHRWGTGSSTAAHIVTNVAATLLIVSTV